MVQKGRLFGEEGLNLGGAKKRLYGKYYYKHSLPCFYRKISGDNEAKFILAQGPNYDYVQ